MRKMNRIIPFALACAIFAAQPVQAATIIRDSDKQTTSQNTQTTTAGTQAGNEGGPGYENSTSNNTNSGNTQSQVSAAAKRLQIPSQSRRSHRRQESSMM